MPGAKPVRSLTPEQSKIVEDNLRLAYSFASQWRIKYPDLIDEITSACMYGLTKAVVLHDPRKSKLSTYAWWAMRYEVFTFLGRNARERRGLIAADDLDTQATSDANRAEERIDASIEIERLLPLLSERQWRILHGKFWMGKTLGEIAMEEGCSRERVRQVIVLAVEIMRVGAKRSKAS